MAKNIIEDYLVSIGCTVNTSEFKKANKEIDGIGGVLKTLFGIINNGVVASAAAITALIASIGPAGKALGNITMGVDKLALNLHTTTRNARSLQTVMQAMGIDSLEDLKYINLIPEQRKQFMELRKVAAENAPTSQALQGLEELKKLGFEFQKFGVKLASLGTEVLGAFGQLLKEPVFKRVPEILEIILDYIRIIANEIYMVTRNAVKNIGAVKTAKNSITHVDAIKAGVSDKAAFASSLGPSGSAASAGILLGDWLFSQFGKNKEIKKAPGVQTTPAIDKWIQSLRPTGNQYQISSALSHGGHSPGSKHYQGLAADIGAAGKSSKELADLAQSALASPLTKNLNVELFEKQAAFMEELRKRGLDKDSRLSFDKRYTKGEHLHFGVQALDNIQRLTDKVKPNSSKQGIDKSPQSNSNQPLTPSSSAPLERGHVNISFVINGAKDAKAVSDEVIARLAPLMNSRDARGYA